MMAKIVVGIDIGGTFTDFVVYNPSKGSIESFKLPTTPHEPADAVIKGLAKIPGHENITIIHGSTVATNALLERKGALTAFVTTKGFRDIIQIGRQNRPSLYDWFAEPAPPLISSDHRYEVNERVTYTGEVLQSLKPDDIHNLLTKLQTTPVESIAVCLLFSFLHPKHEQMIAEDLRKAGYFVSVSSEIMPEYREYERASTTAVNAYVSPILERYLTRLQEKLPDDQLLVMQSNGGMISFSEAQRAGVRCILSGPAGGVIGSHFLAQQLSIGNHWIDAQATGSSTKLITFDMGGTSTDVSMIDGVPKLTTESVIGGCPISIPVLDIHTIGAGGGSIATVDPGGALRVGPKSAGADPGPACYGRGLQPTVTDANLVLGRLVPDFFLGGEIQLDNKRAEKAINMLGAGLRLSLSQTALGIIDIVNTHMERALRVITVERGYDPGNFSLLSFGGAGGLHAVDLARNLGIPRVIISPWASVFSAFGMLCADIIRDYTQTVMLPADTPINGLLSRFERLVQNGKSDLDKEGIPSDQIRVEMALDMRYQGQSYELTIPFNNSYLREFHESHKRLYSYDRQGAPVEIVNLRVRAIGKMDPPVLPESPKAGVDPSPALIGKRGVIFLHDLEHIPFYRGELLQHGNQLHGPAIIVRSDTTIVLGHKDRAKLDRYNNLIIHVGSQCNKINVG